MAAALLDVLCDAAPSHGAGASGTDDSLALLATSLQLHLARLVNARAGGLAHLPDYGLPDLQRIYDALPYSRDDLAHRLRLLVLRYEPRLRSVQVEPVLAEPTDSILRYSVSGLMRNGLVVYFPVLFTGSGLGRVGEPLVTGAGNA